MDTEEAGGGGVGEFISFKIFLLRWYQWYDKTISGIRQFILITFIYFNIVKGISGSVWTFLLILNFDSITLIYCLFILSEFQFKLFYFNQCVSVA